MAGPPGGALIPLACDPLAREAGAALLHAMSDHNGQRLSPREMVRAHAYPMLAAVSTVALVVIAASLVPLARQAQHLNQCIERAAAPGCRSSR